MTDLQDEQLELYIDLARIELPETGIFVRAMHPTTKIYQSVDITHIDHASLMHWLRSRGGENQWAEDCVALLLGHKL